MAKNNNQEKKSNMEKRLIPTKVLTDIELTPKQRELIELMDKNEIIVVTGPAGTSKTFLDCYYAIKSLRDNKFERVIFSKPAQEAGEKLGLLPGTIEEKIDPYYESFKSTILKMITKPNYTKLLERNALESRPLAYMRGATFDSSLMILDEAQNASMKQLLLFITRMGKGSKIIISGDVRQYDINKNDVALPFLAEKILNGIEGVAWFEFNDDDIMRNKILIEITKRYEELKYENKIPKQYF